MQVLWGDVVVGILCAGRFGPSCTARRTRPGSNRRMGSADGFERGRGCRGRALIIFLLQERLRRLRVCHKMKRGAWHAAGAVSLVLALLSLPAKATAADDETNKKILRDAAVGAMTGAAAAEATKDEPKEKPKEAPKDKKAKKHASKEGRRPPGWDRGKKTGWDGGSEPPGLRKDKENHGGGHGHHK